MINLFIFVFFILPIQILGNCMVDLFYYLDSKLILP